MAAAAARAVKAGTDLDCGNEYLSLIPALEQKLIVEGGIDASVRRLLTARFRLGMFDPPPRGGGGGVSEVGRGGARRSLLAPPAGGPLPPGHVRPAGARPVHEDSVYGGGLGGASGAGAGGRAQIDRKSTRLNS